MAPPELVEWVAPMLTHWLSPGYTTHTAHVGLLPTQVPGLGVTLRFAAGAGVAAARQPGSLRRAARGEEVETRLRSLRAIPCAILLVAFAAPAVAGPAMFSASFILHAFGNDVSSGVLAPYTSNDWAALPLGENCRDPSKYTIDGDLAPYYCGPTTLRAGRPAIGSGTLVLGTGSPAAIAFPQSAFGIVTVGARPLRAGHLQSDTYASLFNASGSFFAGGGPGSISRYYGCGEPPPAAGCPLVIQNGSKKFGGAMPLLGRLGGAVKWTSPGLSGTFALTSSWNMIKALGRRAFYGDTPNPYTNTGMFYNKAIGVTGTFSKYGRGTLWTTGRVAVYAEEGSFTTILQRTGYDNRTPGGFGNIQVVTPALTHWHSKGTSYWNYTGHIGILTIHVPEPSAVLLLVAGVGALVGLQRATRRR